MALLKEIVDIVTGKGKREKEFSDAVCSSNIGDFLPHINEKGFRALENFQTLVDASKKSEAKIWLENTSHTLFENDQERMEIYRRFQRGDVSNIPEEKRSAIAVYLTAYRYFSMDQEASACIQENRDAFARQMREGRRIQRKADAEMARAEKDMAAVDKMIEQSTAKMERVIFHNDGPDI